MDNVKPVVTPQVTPQVTPIVFKIAPNTWGDKKTKLKNKFTQLNDADLHFDEGKESELTGRLRTKLNKSEVEVQELITAL